MKVKGIFLNWIVVRDIEAAIKFYTEVMGLTLRQFHKEFGWAELSGPDGCLLGIGQESLKCEQKAGNNAVITISVDDLDKARNELLSKGARLVGEIEEVPEHVRMQTVLDQDGNRLQVVQDLCQK